MTFKKSQLRRFFWWMKERHAIYLRRSITKRPFPWTKDKILQTYRFCNVFRELDRTTIWIRENWREPYADHPMLWFAMALARQINFIDTLAEFGFPEKWDPARLMKLIEDRRERGEKAYTGAYMLTGTLGGPKSGQTAFKILDVLYHDPPPFVQGGLSSVTQVVTLQEAWNQFRGRPGFGPFIAYEVVTDLRHTRYLRGATDIMTWANPGPGAIRGLHRVAGRRIKGRYRRDREPLPRDQAIDEMRKLLSLSGKFLPDDFPVLEMREIEHSLCEHDKYERVRLGEGKMRARFYPPS